MVNLTNSGFWLLLATENFVDCSTILDEIAGTEMANDSESQHINIILNIRFYIDRSNADMI